MVLRAERGRLALKTANAIERVTGKRPTTVSGKVTTLHLYSLQWARLLGEFGKRAQKHLPTKYLCSHPSTCKACTTVW